jgi:hypothetical protein
VKEIKKNDKNYSLSVKKEGVRRVDRERKRKTERQKRKEINKVQRHILTATFLNHHRALRQPVMGSNRGKNS